MSFVAVGIFSAQHQLLARDRAVAATQVKLLAGGEKQFLFLVSRPPHFAFNVMRVLARRLRAANSTM